MRIVSPKNPKNGRADQTPTGPKDLFLPFKGILLNTIRRLDESRKEEKPSACDIFEVITPLWYGAKPALPGGC
jgi:hypothetical protein